MRGVARLVLVLVLVAGTASGLAVTSLHGTGTAEAKDAFLVIREPQHTLPEILDGTLYHKIDQNPRDGVHVPGVSWVDRIEEPLDMEGPIHVLERGDDAILIVQGRIVIDFQNGNLTPEGDVLLEECHFCGEYEAGEEHHYQYAVNDAALLNATSALVAWPDGAEVYAWSYWLEDQSGHRARTGVYRDDTWHGTHYVHLVGAITEGTVMQLGQAHAYASSWTIRAQNMTASGMELPGGLYEVSGATHGLELTELEMYESPWSQVIKTPWAAAIVAAWLLLMILVAYKSRLFGSRDHWLQRATNALDHGRARRSQWYASAAVGLGATGRAFVVRGQARALRTGDKRHSRKGLADITCGYPDLESDWDLAAAARDAARLAHDCGQHEEAQRWLNRAYSLDPDGSMDLMDELR